MEFTRTRSAEGVELHVTGRLDGFRAGQFAEELGRLIGEGVRQIRLDLAEVSYLSSAGIGVIVKYHQDLQKLDGNLVVAVASAPVQRVLEMARLGALVSVGKSVSGVQWPVSSVGTVTIEVEVLEARARLRRWILGDPEVLRGVLVEESRAGRLRVGGALLAVGIGAFGKEFGQCCDRFGDFLAVGSSAAYLPSDGSNVPDYLVGGGDMVVLYAVVCEGAFSHRIRFQSARVVEVLEAGRKAVGEEMGMILVGDTEGGSMVAAGVGRRLCAAHFGGRGRAPEELFRSRTLARVGPPEDGQVLLSGYCLLGS
jgi:anti-anti-sigma factor